MVLTTYKQSCVCFQMSQLINRTYCEQILKEILSTEEIICKEIVDLWTILSNGQIVSEKKMLLNSLKMAFHCFGQILSGIKAEIS